MVGSIKVAFAFSFASGSEKCSVEPKCLMHFRMDTQR